MIQEFDLNQLNYDNTDSYINMLNISDVKKYNVLFHDGERKLIYRKYLIFSLFFWKIFFKWEIRIPVTLALSEDAINDAYIAAYGTKIINLIYSSGKIKDINVLNYDFWKLINELNNFILKNCQEYHCSISIYELALLKKGKEMQNVLSEEIDTENFSVSVVENKLKKMTNKIFSVFENPNTKNNTLFPYINLKYINATQIHHIFHWIGYRTDIDDSIISYCSKGGYLDGLNNVFEYIVESLSAKKNAYYSKEAIPNSQYFLRKQHLLSSATAKIYPGDCGSRLTIPFMITEANAKNILGKNILENNKIIRLNNTNINNYINHTVRLKSVCNHIDGICEMCGGEIFTNINKNINIGIFSSMQVADPVVQRILSSKHFQQTNSLEYKIPYELKDMFLNSKQAIYFRAAYKNKLHNIKLGFNVANMKKILNIADIKIINLESINESIFNRIKNIYIKYNNKYIIPSAIPLEYKNQCPLFSKNMIMYLKTHQDNIHIDNRIYWIDLKDFDKDDPIFKTMIVNESMVIYVSEVKKFIETNIKKYTSLSEALKDFSELIYRKININIVFIETMLKGYLIKNELDNRIPQVLDVENIKFGSNLDINMQRSFGALLAFERLTNALPNSNIYLIPKKYYLFDNFINYKRNDFITY